MVEFTNYLSSRSEYAECFTKFIAIFVFMEQTFLNSNNFLFDLYSRNKKYYASSFQLQLAVHSDGKKTLF